MLNIIINGCYGKLGSSIVNAAYNTKFCIAAGISRTQRSTKHHFPVFNNINSCDINADIVIDSSSAQGTKAAVAYALEKKLPLVICTTGLSDDILTKITQASKSIPLLVSANMSLGIAILTKLTKIATEAFYSQNFANNFESKTDIEIIESHHSQKKDAPSGTALLLANTINNQIKQLTGAPCNFALGRQQNLSKRGTDEIGIHSIRGGNIVGNHSVLYAFQDETLELRHTAQSRKAFADGTLYAAGSLINMSAGLYNMDDIIF